MATHADTPEPRRGVPPSLSRRLQRYRKLRLTDGELAVLLLSPGLLYLAVVSYYPIVDTLWISLHEGAVRAQFETTWVGLDHFENVLFDDSFQNAFVVTMIYTFGSVPVEMVLGVLLAILINRDFWGRYVALAAILFPWALPTIINAKIWKWLFHSQYGVINDLLVRTGLLAEPFPFLAHPDTALYAMLIVTIWKTTSFVALIALAGLQGIPQDLYDAALIDGANRFQQFRYVTLPLLKPVLLVALIFRTLPAFQAFGLPYGLTNGGPGGSTKTLVLWAHETQAQLNFGESAAAATIITLVALAICLVYVLVLYEPEVQ